MAQIPIKDARDESEVKPLGTFEPLPVGTYVVVVQDSDHKETSKRNGTMFTFTYEVVQDGEYKGRLVFDNMIDAHESSKAAQFGKQKLGQLMRAVNKPQAKDTKELHGIPFELSVKIQKGDERYGDSNTCVDYQPCGTGGEKKTTSAAGGNKLPWEGK
jgi:hypothetical protein